MTTIQIDLEKFPTVKQMEKLLIIEAMKYANGNRSKAARLLGISARNLREKLYRVYKIVPESEKPEGNLPRRVLNY